MKLQISLYLLSALLQYMQYGITDAGIPGIQISLPPSHIALSDDLHLQIISEDGTFPPLLLQLSRLDDDGATVTTLTTFPVLPEARALSLKATPVRVPCGYFSRGGQYYVLVKKQPMGIGNSSANSDTGSDTINNNNEEVLMQTLDVRWPMPQLRITPDLVQTYPERSVSAILEFLQVVCPPVADTAPAAIPEFWLQLRYCGHSLLTCDDDDMISIGGGGGLVGDPIGVGMGLTKNETAVNKILFSEQIRGFPGRRLFTLRCEFFGLAGYYSLVLKPSKPTPSLPHTAAYVKADWSESFVFNVHARSIFPCDPHAGGIKVLFNYPACIVTGDRVRLFARLRADVASLAPPTSLVYVAEHRVRRGEHVLRFDCDLFSERYVQYCFVYVSQAITGAVADVRQDCVPTLPISESEVGGWSEWSPWTPCSTTCLGGTKSRYRFCESPPPGYGAKYCEGAMAKGKGAKKGGKKKSKKAKTSTSGGALITEVDKTFYELQITDLNRKLARLRSLTLELEEKNEDLKSSNEKLEEDHNDIIAYLKRTLQEKVDEIREVKERLKVIQEKNIVQDDRYKEKISEMEIEYKDMKEQLNSEIKLLSGKLNSLDEFRQHRDELMKKYEVQELAMEDQEMKHKRETYNIERKFIVGKDRLKQQMESRLLQLSTEFQDVTDLRIASTTHRVIRENIAINNELTEMLESQERLQKENDSLKERDMNLRLDNELQIAEKKISLKKVKLQQRVIDQLTEAYGKVETKLKQYGDMEEMVNEYKRTLASNNNTLMNLNTKVRVLEQNLHVSRCERNIMQTELDYCQDEHERLTKIIYAAVIAVKSALQIDVDNLDNADTTFKRETLLNNLLNLMTTAQEKKQNKPSLESVCSVSVMYKKGDLGFVPRPVHLRSRLPIKHCIEQQMGSSFSSFIRVESSTVIGEAVETVRCGHSLGNGWECFHTVGANSAGAATSGSDVSSVAETADLAAEVGAHCLCGCIVHLGHNMPRRLLATSSHTCPGRIYWQIQAEEDCIIQIRVEQFQMPCGTQYLKIRDGLRPSDTLLEDLSDPNMPPATINSTSSNLLLEFYSDDLATYNQYCGGGFLAYAMQFKQDHTNASGIPIAQSIGVLPLVALKLTAVHVAAIFFLAGLLIATALLGAQYMVRYRKYHIAQAEDQDSLADGSSCNSLPLTVRAASSNATLLSEVISLHRLRPPPRNGGGGGGGSGVGGSIVARHKHTRLRESLDCDEVMTESGDEDVTTMSTTALSASEVEARDMDVKSTSRGGVTLAKEEESLSLSSTTTLTPEDTNPASANDAKQISSEYDEEDTNKDLSESTTSSQFSSDDKVLKRSSTIVSSDKDRSTEKEDVCVQLYVRRPSITSVANLTNVSTHSHSHSHTNTYRIHCRPESGSYSPALSTTSTATVRSTNIKESKDKRNRERLLAGPVGSEFSLVGPEVDLELDYYDYNVVNAGAAPGSYLGMDPAFLVWIPPLDDSGEILDESGEVQLKPQSMYIDPKSNTESPEEEELLLPKQRPRSFSEDNTASETLLITSKSKNKGSILLEAQKKLRIRSKNNSSEEIVSIQLHEYPIRGKEKKVLYREKETKVEKSPSSEVSSFDDIKFADDEDEDNRKESDSNRCEIGKLTARAYHEDLSNVISKK